MKYSSTMLQTWCLMIVVLSMLSLNDLNAVPMRAAVFAEPEEQVKTPVVTLDDFTKEEVKGIGITLDKDLRVDISGAGGGDRSFWSDWKMTDDDQSSEMFAAGWIIDATTRTMVWQMTMENTSGKTANRICHETIELKRGSYEVYYAAYGYVSRSPFSSFIGNIDRREHRPSDHESSGSTIGKIFKEIITGSDDLQEEFMDHAKNDWHLILGVDQQDARSVATFAAPRPSSDVLISAAKLGDGAVVKKGITVAREAILRLYAEGEGRNRDEIFDYGWIENRETRERLWEMKYQNSEYGGGARKNLVYRGEVKLPKGTYDLVFCTDGSHSCDDWNAMPPADPFNYGVTVSLANPKDRSMVNVIDPEDLSKNAIVQLTKVRDSDMKSQGFSLAAPATLHVYALGESIDGREFADYGWITNTKTHERVWTMEGHESSHAGGATKNRLVDELITLPKGNYIAAYQTDDSHAYRSWNADPPFDVDHWGLTICGRGKDFDPAKVKLFSEEFEEGVLAQLIRVRDGRHVEKSFTVKAPAKIRVYALGESDGREMADYGWIQNATTGDLVWEMTYSMSTAAGGAHKNRMVNRTVHLDAGEYKLHYKTDGSHAFGDWNDDPPEDQIHWGITLYNEE
ncbi:MAG: hypothetical protein EHM64_09445 [Ignavibacteriae bacterium]|nr:MAG: hypothetical protein EHM64_09445 [Ignavibacteriota bacterium]